MHAVMRGRLSPDAIVEQDLLEHPAQDEGVGGAGVDSAAAMLESGLCRALAADAEHPVAERHPLLSLIGRFVSPIDVPSLCPVANMPSAKRAVTMVMSIPLAGDAARPLLSAKPGNANKPT